MTIYLAGQIFLLSELYVCLHHLSTLSKITISVDNTGCFSMYKKHLTTAR